MTQPSLLAAVAIGCLVLTAPLSAQRSGRATPPPAGWGSCVRDLDAFAAGDSIVAITRRARMVLLK